MRRESAATTLQASLRISGAKRIVQEKRERQAGIDQARLRAHGGMAQMDALAVIEQWWSNPNPSPHPHPYS